MHPWYLRVLAAIFMLVFLLAAVALSQRGFADIQAFKQLERIVPATLAGVLDGENQLSGTVAALAGTLPVLSPHTQTPSVYYRYKVERKETDSDGKTRWVTEQDTAQAVDFMLQDGQAEAYVHAAGQTEITDWLLPRRSQHRSNGRRYTEWRLEPGDSVLIFASAELTPQQAALPAISLRFDTPGHYLPIVASLSAEQIRSDMGNMAIVKIWAGVALLALALLCLVYLLQIHRILLYLSLLALATGGMLAFYGVTMLVADVSGGAEYVLAQRNKAEAELSRLVAMQPGALQQSRIAQIRINMAVQQAVYQQQISRFPAKTYAHFGMPAGVLQQVGAAITLSTEQSGQLQQRLQQFSATRVTGSAWWWVLAGLVVFMLCAKLGLKAAWRKRLLENIPTSATAGVCYGLAEVQGEAALVQQQALQGPLSGQQAVWYRYVVQQRRQRGKKSYWFTLSNDIKTTRFACRDSEGQLLLDVQGADVITRHKTTRSAGNMRYSEWLLKPGDTLYAIGQAQVDPEQTDRLMLAKSNDSSDDSPFIITNYSERELMIKKAFGSMLALCLAFCGMFLAAVFYGGMQGQFSATDYLAAGLLAPLCLIGFMFVLHYNDLIFLQRRAARNWANIQVSLKKRADLLPALQQVVVQYQAHEHDLLQQITVLRTQVAGSTASVQSAGNFIRQEQQLLSELTLRAEALPQLKADVLLLQLMATLTGLENEIALMRTGFNDAVTAYNTRLQSVPDIVLAKAFNFTRLDCLHFTAAGSAAIT